MNARSDSRKPGGVWAVVVARAGTALIDVCAFWLSATTLTDLARRAGIDPMQAWMWPVIVDGMIVVATVAIVALARHGPRATVYPWALLIAGALVSVTANCLHALVAADSDLPAVLSASVAAVPPLVLLAATHLTVQLGRRLTHTPSPGDERFTRVTEPNPPPRMVPAARETRTSAVPRTTTADTAVAAPALSAALSPNTPAFTALAEGLEADGGERLGTRVRQKHEAAEAEPVQTPRAAVAGSDARDQAISLSEEGLSNRAIATRLGVHPSTVGRWLASSAATLPPAGRQTSSPSEHPAQTTGEGRPEPDRTTAAPDSKEPQP